MLLLSVAFAAAVLALLVVLRGERAPLDAGVDAAQQLSVSMALGVLACITLFVVYGVVTT